jgi:hypothetical protein
MELIDDSDEEHRKGRATAESNPYREKGKSDDDPGIVIPEPSLAYHIILTTR